jgi:hypothetical protein
MNDQEKKELIKQNENNTGIMDSAIEYLQSTDNHSQEEYIEMITTINPKVSKKAARGIYKVAYFRSTGKKL